MKSDFTVNEFAQVLSVSLPTIWKYIGRGDIAAYRVGRSVRIPHDELARIRESNRIEVTKNCDS
ncbi:Helix-turn-helix domain protein [Marinobacterium sp. xm-g-59]|uniref:helix-turn-helix domain-containing protein n=1 Tax=Marinobacterium sp. xm-g-59 TaxID=2497748 RepID=UPI00156870E9|nr:Helix-turn-helix domain protein [Marinobacterium sp. xm-g-59]